MFIEQARKLRKIIEQAATSLDDKTVSEGVLLLPRLKQDNSLVSAGTRINWNGIVKRASVDLWDTTENNPDNNPGLWEDIEYKDGYRIIHETLTVGTGFSKGEIGWWKDELYESIYEDLNVWNPDQYSVGWRKIEQ